MLGSGAPQLSSICECHKIRSVALHSFGERWLWTLAHTGRVSLARARPCGISDCHVLWRSQNMDRKHDKSLQISQKLLNYSHYPVASSRKAQ